MATTINGLEVVEARVIENGKSLGFEGEKLKEYVDQKLLAIEKREERAAQRSEAKLAEEFQQKLEALERQLRESRAEADDNNDEDDDNDGEAEESQRRKTAAIIKMPKYDGKQSLVAYLELFEDIAAQNKFSEGELLIRLRVAVAGTKLEKSCFGCKSYVEAKRELFRAHGMTADKAWKKLDAVQQATDESFHQFVVKVARAVELWSKLALSRGEPVDELSMFNINVEEMDDTLQALVKQLVLEAASVDLRAFLLERKCYEMSLAEFQSSGTAYQDAHGSKRPGTKQQADHFSTHCLALEVEEVEKKLAAMPAEKRFSWIVKENRCMNCLKPGHRAAKCFGKTRCDSCPKKHHSLLHKPESGKKIAAYSCGVNSQVHLMTGAGEVGGRKKARVRIFLDPGSQASFITSELVDAILPERVAQEAIDVKAFGTETRREVVNKYRLTVTGTTGPISVEAWEQSRMGVEVPTVDPSVCQRWEQRGITLSDRAGCSSSPGIHLLLGADYCNLFLHEKKQVDNEVAWQSEIGWILSGPESAAATSTTEISVSCLHVQPVERLWALEEPLQSGPHLPSFPLVKQDEQYEVGLLWKSSERPADNRDQAAAALRSVLKRLATKPDASQQYEDVLMKEYQELGAIEREPDPSSSGYYLPHHAVIREQSETTKVRVVFNASACIKGQKSLNDLLLAGPSLLPDLVGLLFRFREAAVAYQADVKKAFFMIGVQPEDRPFLRFLWPGKNGELETWRLTRLPFGVNCSPFLLSAIIAHHLKELLKEATDSEREVIELLLRSLYVDDCVSSLNNASQAEEFKVSSCKALASAGMELRKWHILGQSESEESKVLGVRWILDSDSICLAKPSVDDTPERWTRRHLLRHLAAFFDPLGLASPVLLTGKILLQKAWKVGTDWDKPLPESLSKEIRTWWGVALQLPDVKSPRWLGTQLEQEVDIHVFTDASEKAMGACVYVVHEQGAQLLYAKTRVAPVKVLTLARLELQALWIGARAANFVISHLRLRVASVHGWSDSLTALYWIRGQPYRWKTWVANRVQAVQEVAITWHHCPGIDNPADIASRGARSTADVDTERWWHGPEWLCQSAKWPEACALEPSTESIKEVKLNVVQASVATEKIEPFWEKHSSWVRLKRFVSILLRWRYRQSTRAELSVKAELALVKISQRSEWEQDYVSLSNGREVSRQSKLVRYGPVVDSAGLIRATTRLDNADIPTDAKSPILLPKHWITVLMLRHVHVSRAHQGVEGCIAHVRQRFLVVAVRRMLRDIKQRCVICRRFDAVPVSEVPAPLPSDRVQHQRPFAVVGIDHAGPIFVKEGNDVIKSWILLFVCATTRAVHLELVLSLSTTDVLLAYRRFAAIWGEPTLVRSDRGTAFMAASKQLDVEWRFNPPAAPWHGGFYERLVGVIKAPLRKVLGRALVSSAELRTVLAEIQAVVNDRPLTHVGAHDEPLPLTPTMLLGIKVGANSAAEVSLTPANASRRLKYLQQLQANVRSRWVREYVTALRLFTARHTNNIAVGDIVLLVEDQKKRVMWKLARVQKLFPGRDGRSRVAEIRVGGHTLIRPVQRLVPLEISYEPSAETNETAQSVTAEEPQVAPGVAPSAEPVTVAAGQDQDGVRRTRTRAVRPPARYRV